MIRQLTISFLASWRSPWTARTAALIDWRDSHLDGVKQEHCHSEYVKLATDVFADTDVVLFME